MRARTAKEFVDLIERVRAIPGVAASAIVSGGVPLTGSLTTTDFAVAGRSLSERERDIDIDEISPDYFTVLRVPLLAGRVFTTNDDAGAERVVVLNEIAARTYFGGASAALDRIVRLGKVDRRVVGVVGNIRHDGPESDWRRETFVPFSQLPGFGATLVVRSMIPSSAVTDGVKNAIWSVFPDVTIPETPTLESDLHGLLAEHRFNMLLLGLFGILAIVIAGLGIYGVLAYAVTERTQEIGIRMALGAAPGTIVGAVLGRASLYLAAGLGAGLAGAWLLAGFVDGFSLPCATARRGRSTRSCVPSSCGRPRRPPSFPRDAPRASIRWPRCARTDSPAICAHISPTEHGRRCDVPRSLHFGRRRFPTATPRAHNGQNRAVARPLRLCPDIGLPSSTFIPEGTTRRREAQTECRRSSAQFA